MASPPAPTPSRWLFGPIPDLLFGCGFLYAFVILMYGVFGETLRAAQPSYLMVGLILMLSMPHYGGTLLRVYEQRQERQRYLIFSVYASLGVLGLFVLSIYNAYLGSLMFTVYLTWSPWHYTGQNYGLAMMFLRRRGVDVTPNAKRWLYASFLLSYALTFLVMHGIQTVGYSPFDYSGAGILFLPLGLPPSIIRVALPLVGAAYVVTLIVSSALLLRGGRARDLLPSWALAGTQALWFSVPFSVMYLGTPTGLEPMDAQLIGLRDYTIWIWIGHGVQYLWVTTFYARAAQSWNGYASYLGKAVITGVAIWTLPVLVFAPDALGTLSYSGGLALLVAAAVNLHHFILDGAIWKLRNMRIASVLIRDTSEETGPGAITPPTSWLEHGVWAAAAAGCAVAFFVFWQEQLVLPPAMRSGDVPAAQAVLDRLAWVGRDDERDRLSVATLAVRQKNVQAALVNYRRSGELRPSVTAFSGVGYAETQLGHPAQAAKAYERVLELVPDHAEGLLQAGRSWLAAGEVERSVPLLERAAELRPEHEDTQKALEYARSARRPESANSPAENPTP